MVEGDPVLVQRVQRASLKIKEGLHLMNKQLGAGLVQSRYNQQDYGLREEQLNYVVAWHQRQMFEQLDCQYMLNGHTDVTKHDLVTMANQDKFGNEKINYHNVRAS